MRFQLYELGDLSQDAPSMETIIGANKDGQSAAYFTIIKKTTIVYF